MKYCLINNLYKPYSVGGAEKYLEEEAKQLARAGNKVIIITSAPFRGWRHRTGVCLEDSVKVYRVWMPNIFWYGDLPKHGFFGKLAWHFFDIFNFWSGRIIKKILITEKPDEIQTHNLMGIGYGLIPSLKGEGSLLNALKKANNNTKLQSPEKGFLPASSAGRNVCVLHDVQLVEPSGVLSWHHEKDKLYQKIYSLIMKWRMGRPDEIVCLSEFMRDFYQSRGFFPESEYSVISTKSAKGGRVEESLKQCKRDSSTPLRFARNDITNFLFVGSLVKHKGIRVLMQAWSKCHSERSEESLSNASLHFVGDGILYKEIDDWAKTQKNVIVHGRLEGEELEKIYQESDVLIFPSICIENRPTVILEAKKYGLKIIASDTGGAGEFIGEGDVLVEPGDAGGLTKALKCAIFK